MSLNFLTIYISRTALPRVSSIFSSSTSTSTTTTTTTTTNRAMATGVPSMTAEAHKAENSSPEPEADFGSIGVKNTNINTAEGVDLNARQKLCVGSVLDLFEGRPSLKHLSLWEKDATFTDPLSIATGYSRYAAQWYGLPTVFSPIKIISHRVISSQHPIEMELHNRYTIKALKKAHEIKSIVRIEINPETHKIMRVEDRWDGKLPDNTMAEAFRKLNAVTVPMVVHVPKTEEEDQKMREEREKA
ncbi:hypothetical protein QBC47DRAFT_375121 [Echria macrotheca]|uniref:Uncharacterized protein n=1 Tax=Echria macrotheca TaxID=438768 RepID=A0AAJ0FEX0_9PEZI|nr:hypothetical protein QBC47DRAFT_375121 [Echria macrotheca]